MGLACKIFGHKWNWCQCSKCGAKRDEQHNWENGKCNVCGEKQQPSPTTVTNAAPTNITGDNDNPYFSNLDSGNQIFSQLIHDAENRESQVTMASNLLFGKCGTALLSGSVFSDDVVMLFKAIGWELNNAHGRVAMQDVFNNIMNRYPMLGVSVSKMWNDIDGWNG